MIYNKIGIRKMAAAAKRKQKLEAELEKLRTQLANGQKNAFLNKTIVIFRLTFF